MVGGLRVGQLVQQGPRICVFGKNGIGALLHETRAMIARFWAGVVEQARIDDVEERGRKLIVTIKVAIPKYYSRELLLASPTRWLREAVTRQWRQRPRCRFSSAFARIARNAHSVKLVTAIAVMNGGFPHSRHAASVGPKNGNVNISAGQRRQAFCTDVPAEKQRRKEDSIGRQGRR